MLPSFFLCAVCYEQCFEALLFIMKNDITKNEILKLSSPFHPLSPLHRSNDTEALVLWTLWSVHFMLDTRCSSEQAHSVLSSIPSPLTFFPTLWQYLGLIFLVLPLL
ncbi:unnamed protein product [Discosporangium mesarthrocarpum]